MGTQDRRPRPRGREGRGALRGGPDRQARRGGGRDCLRRQRPAARHAAGASASGPTSQAAIAAVAASTGLETEQVEKLRARPSSTCCPRRWASSWSTPAIPAGTRCPTRRCSTSSTWSPRRPSFPSTRTSSPPAPPCPIRSRSRSRSGSRPARFPIRRCLQPPGRQRGPHRGPRPVQPARRLADRHHVRRGRRGHRQPARGRADERQGAEHVGQDHHHVRRAGRQGEGHRLRAAQGQVGGARAVRQGHVQEIPHPVQQGSTTRSTCLSGTRSRCPAQDAEIAAQLKAVRAYWNKTQGEQPGGQDGQVVPEAGRRAKGQDGDKAGDRRLVAGEQRPDQADNAQAAIEDLARPLSRTTASSAW